MGQNVIRIYDEPKKKSVSNKCIFVEKYITVFTWNCKQDSCFQDW